MSINFLETSAKNSINVELAFKTLITDIMNNIMDSGNNSNDNIQINKKTKENKSCCIIT